MKIHRIDQSEVTTFGALCLGDVYETKHHVEGVVLMKIHVACNGQVETRELDLTDGNTRMRNDNAPVFKLKAELGVSR